MVARSKKYGPAEFARMIKLRKAGKTYREIGEVFGVTAGAIENQFYENLHEHTSDRPLRVPPVTDWDFRGQDVA